MASRGVSTTNGALGMSLNVSSKFRWLWATVATVHALSSRPPYPPDLVKPAALSRFVTQRAVQQQLYYFELNMDETSGDYLAEHLRPPPTEDEDDSRSPPLDADYHGVGALPSRTSCDYLCALLDEDDLEIVVKKPMGCAAGRGHGGINGLTGEPINRGANPYLKPRYVEYVFDVRPKQIAQRVFAIREQVAEECAADLRDLVARESDDVRERALYGTEAPVFDDTRQGGAGQRASPFRGATYDLILQLATAATIDELLREDAATFAKLDAIWREFRPSFFRHNPWTRGDPSRRSVTHGLFEALVGIAPGFDGEKLVSDPTTAVVLERRAQLARAWADALGDVPEENARWNRWALEKSFASTA